MAFWGKDRRPHNPKFYPQPSYSRDEARQTAANIAKLQELLSHRWVT